MPAGYDNQTGYQYDSISRVAGQRDPAPPSNLSKLGGFKNSVFIADDIGPPQRWQPRPTVAILLHFHEQPKPCFLDASYWKTFANWPVACKSVSCACSWAKSASKK